MQLGGYRLLSQLGAGRDGVWYQAERRTGGERVEVHVLAGARGDAIRWADLVKRLRMAALLSDPSARRLLELGLEHDPPFVAMEGIEGRLPAETSPEGGSPTWSEAVAGAAGLARGMAEAHRLGLTHGRLVQVTTSGRGSSGLKFDWTGLHGDDEGGADRCRGERPGRATSSRGACPIRPTMFTRWATLLAGWLTGGPIARRTGSGTGGDPDLDCADRTPCSRPTRSIAPRRARSPIGSPRSGARRMAWRSPRRPRVGRHSRARIPAG